MHVVALLVLGAAATRAQQPPPGARELIAGAAPSYQVVHGWPLLPEGSMLGIVSAVAVDSHNHVFIFDRRDRAWAEPGPMDTKPIPGPTVEMFDGLTGALLATWGENTFALPHGLTIDSADNVWLTDVALHQVYKYSHDGKLLLTVGERGVPGTDSAHFDKPSGIVAAPDGSFFVSDGYGNSRVMKFASDGKYVAQWGVKGSSAGEFDLPHGIARDRDGRLFVSDRSNGRVQLFDRNGKFMSEWKGPPLVSPNNVAFGPDGRVYVVDDGGTEIVPDRSGIVVMDRNGTFIERFGRLGNYDGQFVAVHSVAVGRDGAVYVADADGKRVQKFLRRSK
jgi:peptidylamidoglycolate lyase